MFLIYSSASFHYLMAKICQPYYLICCEVSVLFLRGIWDYNVEYVLLPYGNVENFQVCFWKLTMEVIMKCILWMGILWGKCVRDIVNEILGGWRRGCRCVLTGQLYVYVSVSMMDAAIHPIWITYSTALKVTISPNNIAIFIKFIHKFCSPLRIKIYEYTGINRLYLHIEVLFTFPGVRFLTL